MSESNNKYDLEERLIQFTLLIIDFVHKMKICLKELKETHVALQIIRRKSLVKDFIRQLAD